MTEKEKMLAGMLYDPFCEGMPEQRAAAHRLCKLYNDTFDSDADRRREILDQLLPDRGEGVWLQGPIWFDFGVNTHFGAGSYANFNLTVLDEARVEIGENVFMGPNVSLYTPVHPMRWQDRNPFFNPETGQVTNLEYAAAITVGDNCWICGDVTVCGGVTIGPGCVIGAGSVVTRDVPPDSFAAGNPCRVIRPVTDADRAGPRLRRRGEKVVCEE